MKRFRVILFLFCILAVFSFPVAEAANSFWDGTYAVYNTSGQYVGDNKLVATGMQITITHPNGQVTQAVFVEFQPGQHFIRVSAWGEAEGRCTEVSSVCRQIWWTKGNQTWSGRNWGRKD